MTISEIIMRSTDGHCLTILLTSSAEPGSTEQADSWELDTKVCEISDRYWAVAWFPVQLRESQERPLDIRGKYTSEASETTAAI
jgi:hypothetical protein